MKLDIIKLASQSGMSQILPRTEIAETILERFAALVLEEAAQIVRALMKE